MATNFTNRPLRDTAADRRLFVDRSDDLQALVRTLKLRFNVLALSEPGAGMTTLLNRLVAELPDAVRLNAESCNSAAELFAVASAARNGPPIARGDGYGSREALADLAPKVGHDTVLLVDRLPPSVAHDVFGRMRDELWELDARWLVAARKVDEPVVTTPPADAFFDATHELGPLTVDDVVELLERRDEDGLVAPAARIRIAERSEGNPREALRLARAVVLSGPEALEEDGAAGLLDRVRTQLGEPAARLAGELASGPIGPSDEALRHRLGWSQPRLYEVFRQLEQAGFVARGTERNGHVGRPRAVYALNNGG